LINNLAKHVIVVTVDIMCIRISVIMQVRMNYTNVSECICTNSWVSAYTLYFLKLESLAYIFVAACMGLSSFKFVHWAPKDASLSAPECVLVVQGHPRSMILVPIESAYTTSY